MDKKIFASFLILASTIVGTYPIMAKAQSTVTSDEQIEPTRRWLGTQYAETVVSEFRRLHPEINLTLQLNDLAGAKPHSHRHLFDRSTAGPAAEQFFKNLAEIFRRKDFRAMGEDIRSEMVNSIKNTFPVDIKNLLQTLEAGAQFGGAFGHKRFKNILTKWVLSQPDGSLAPHDFMIQALKIYDGHIISAWMLAWDIANVNG